MTALLGVTFLTACGSQEERLIRQLLDPEVDCELNDRCFQDDEFDCGDSLLEEKDLQAALDELSWTDDEMKACRKADKAADECALESSCSEVLSETDQCGWGEGFVPCCKIAEWSFHDDRCEEETSGPCHDDISEQLERCGALLRRADAIAHDREFGWRPDGEPRLAPEASCRFEENGAQICASFARSLSAETALEVAWCDSKSGVLTSGDHCEGDETLGQCVVPPIPGQPDGARQVIYHYQSVDWLMDEDAEEDVPYQHDAAVIYSHCVGVGDYLPPAHALD